ncbi:EamA family transporter [Altererythrobacter salegens]|uniref:EamA family transporter n=1 Tax=Croceibacterium salegens TaxID=1737568 RepID=A0A6I4SV17_9SPHN|nr:EamA family transporter [Croceibacterium salegens]MXO59338.1 EamA family transporter [Croceibacterium salegens]
MQAVFTSWQFWTLLSALFAALTAILAKVGVQGIDPDLATFVRTIIVAGALATLLALTGKLSGEHGMTRKAMLFLTLSGLATGASWLCYFRALSIGEAAQVAPVDKLSVVLVAVLGVVLLGERLTAYGWIGVALVTAGGFLIAWRG